MPDPTSPISFRPDPIHRELLAEYLGQGVNASAVLKRALDLLAQSGAYARAPLHPLSVDDPRVYEAVEQAANAACEVLDELFKGKGPIETHGIGSNFRGLLGDHLRAMLTGEPAAKLTHKVHLEPLLVRWDSFGRYIEPKGPLQGVTLMRPARKVSDQDLFFSRGRFVALQQVDVGELYTSSDYATKDYLSWLAEQGESPSESPARLVVLDYSSEEPSVLA